MRLDEFQMILSTATSEELAALESAHWRYMTLIGDVRDVVPEDVASQDAARFPQYASQDGGRKIFSEIDCTTFMAEVTGLQELMCDAWADNDFYSRHGVTIDGFCPAAALQC